VKYTTVVDEVLTNGMVMCVDGVVYCLELRCGKGIVMFGSRVDGVALCACVVELCVMDYFEQGIFFSINIEMHLLVFQYILDMINAPKMEHIKTFRVC